MNIKKGTHVRAYGERRIERIVWEDTGLGILLTTDTEYQKALHGAGEPITVGFPKDDIINVGSAVTV